MADHGGLGGAVLTGLTAADSWISAQVMISGRETEP